MHVRRNHNSSLAAAVSVVVLSLGGRLNQPLLAQPEGVLGYEAVEVDGNADELDAYGRVLSETAGSFDGVSVWVNGERVFFPPPLGLDHATGTDMSPTTGLISGIAGRAGSKVAIVWKVDDSTRLPLMPGLAECGAQGINDLGWVVGGCYTFNFGRPALWIRGRDPIDLGDLGGGQASAIDVNERGWVLGGSYRTGERETWPVIWKPNGEIVDLLENIDGEPWFNISGARSFNNHGEVIGSGWYLSEGRLFQTWRVADGCGCDWEAINDRSLFVGMCNPDPGCAVRFRRAYVTEILPDGELRRHNINDFLYHQADVTLLDADDINNAGQIAAFGELPGGEERGFLVTPYQFELSEPVPGIAGERNTITVTNLEPDQRVILVFGTKEGAQPIGNGCLGGLVLIRDASTHKSLEAFADQSGNATFNVLVPKSTAGKTVRYQAIAPDECEISHTVEFRF